MIKSLRCLIKHRSDFIITLLNEKSLEKKPTQIKLSISNMLKKMTQHKNHTILQITVDDKVIYIKNIIQLIDYKSKTIRYAKLFS